MSKFIDKKPDSKLLIFSGENLVHNEIEINERNFLVAQKFGEFLNVLGYDWENDPNMKDTPKRVAKMYMQEITKGTYNLPPKITTFPNGGKYKGMIFSGAIEVKSLCSHHFMPFIGKCYIAYIPKKEGKIIGLSKLNRVVDWFSRRPQLQENLTAQIHEYLNKIFEENMGVIVMIEAQHMCVYMRGVEQNSTMITTEISGVFREKDNLAREEFHNYVNNLKNNK